MSQSPAIKKRWWALYVLCLGDLMIVLDSTIVNVALPSIRQDLGFSENTLVWVVNAYLLTFGGFLLLGGRLGDLFGHRRMCLLGVAFFTAASLACGLAQSREMLIVARAVQGIGGAVVTAAVLSLMMSLFSDPVERTKAMGIFSFTSAGGGSVGVLLGGLLTSAVSWHWIFLVNIPVGALVYVLTRRLIDPDKPAATRAPLDFAGAATITLSLILAVYAIVDGNEAGWTSVQTLGLLGLAAILLAAFVYLESHVEAPLMPLGLFKRRNIATTNVIAVLWAAAMFAWFFISALYMQMILHYTPLEVGLAFLSSNIVMATMAMWLSARIVMRFGIRGPLAIGLFMGALGLALFSRSPMDGSFAQSVLPGMILLGISAGIAFNPLILAAMNDVSPNDSGIASGLVNTSFMMGGALGLAVLASLAAARTSWLTASGTPALEALNGGFQLAFAIAAFCAALGATLGYAFVRVNKPTSAQVVHGEISTGGAV
jgi:EmrB/QacA subfamily drug resistance transporter